ncbi:MAG: tetratricopeptide repeat protein [Deltaproteobacteria bacterium]|nr:tetratricopeptide repeat protein [Deltaproteobacteria bacterium]
MAPDSASLEGKKTRTPILDPNPSRRKRLVELLQKFFDDTISLAELRGYSKANLFALAETGYVKFKHGRVHEAEEIYQALIVLDHRNAYFHAVMGAIHQKKGRPVESILEYSRALQINRKDMASYVNRGEIYLRHRNFRRAAEDFRQAILLDPTGRNLWANRARSLVIALKRQVDAQRESQVAKRGRAVRTQES